MYNVKVFQNGKERVTKKRDIKDKTIAIEYYNKCVSFIEERCMTFGYSGTVELWEDENKIYSIDYEY